MGTAGNVIAQAASIVPPYPAAVTIHSRNWRSSLTRNGLVVLGRPLVQIGRMESNDIVLADPLASRHHAVIRWAPGGYEVEDLGSANGTFLDGQRVQRKAPLRPGQVIRIGGTDLHFNVLESDEMEEHTASDRATASPRPASVMSSLPPSEALPGATLVAGGVVPPTQTPAVPIPPAHPYYALLQTRRENAVARVVRTQLPKRYWRVFVLGLLAYIVVALVLGATANLHLVPLEMLLASGLVPVVFVIFCWEQSAFADMPLPVVGATFASGAILGLTIAAIIEPLLIPANNIQQGIGLGTALLIALVEETAKVVSVAWFLRDRRLRSELDGLILGAAAGMGFAALETAGYGFVAFLVGFATAAQGQNSTSAALILAGVHLMNRQLLLRMALAIFGHGVWTAIVCAAIWRERGQATFRLTPAVLLAFALAVGLHAFWDWSPLANFVSPDTQPVASLVVVFGWFLLIGIAGLVVLRFFLRESLRRAKLGPSAPPPPPLLAAMLADAMNSSPRQPQPAPWPHSQDASLRSQSTAPNRTSGQPGANLAPPPRPPAGVPAHISPPPQKQSKAPQGPAAPPIWPLANGAGALTCPNCRLTYPAGSKICGRCGGPLRQSR